MSISSLGNKLEEVLLSSKKRILGSIVIVVSLLSIPITLSLVGQQQDIRQRASQICSNAPSDIMLVMDKSGSMIASNAISKARDAARNFVDIVSADTNNHVGLVSFSTQSRTTLDSQLTNDFSSVKSKISLIYASGETCTQCGIKKANDEILARKRSGFKNVIILLTDGKANNTIGTDNRANFQEAATAALNEVKTGFSQNGTVFYTIGLGSDIETSFLQEIANTTGGKYFFAPTADNLLSIYQEISQIIGKGSTTGFVFNDINGNGNIEDNEPKLPGWRVDLLSQGQTIESAQSDQSGGFAVTGICNGQYSLKVIPQSGWTINTPQNGTHDILIVNEDSQENKNFAVSQASTTPTPPPTSSPTPTSAPTPTPIPTQTPPTFTPTLEPTSTPFPTATLMPTPTYAPRDALLSLKLLLPGVGRTAEGSNQIPNNLNKIASVAIFSNQNTLVKTVDQSLEFGKGQEADAEKGYAGNINLGQIENGSYIVKAKINNSMWKQIAGFVNISESATSPRYELVLTTGDLNQDNKMDIDDYNIFINCYTEDSSCTQNLKLSSDLNEDGMIDEKDLNIMFRAFANRQGD